MGVLTDSMNRLRCNIEVMRSERLALNQELAHDAKTLNSTVSAMRARFRKEQSADAKHARAARRAFTKDLKKSVGHMRKSISSDLAGAHQAWFGKGL